MIEAHCRDLGHADCATGQSSAVTADYPSIAINQDRDNKTEFLDARRDLPDLFLAVPARVRRIGCQFFDRSINDLEGLASTGPQVSRVITYRLHWSALYS